MLYFGSIAQTFFILFWFSPRDEDRVNLNESILTENPFPIILQKYAPFFKRKQTSVCNLYILLEKV